MQNFKNKLYNYETPPPEEIWQHIKEELQNEKVVKIPGYKKSKNFYYLAVAAASLIIIFIGSLFFKKNSTEPGSEMVSNQKPISPEKLKDSMILNQKILEAIEAVKKFMSTHNKGVLGMHLEGPFINPEKRGAHNKDVIRKPSNAELEEIIRYGKGVIKVMTIAPEQFTDEQLEMLLESGIILSAGHSATSYEQAQYYFNKGIHLVTHLYNAMTQMGHRNPGTVGAVFDNDEVYAPIILDGAHCDYAAARIAYKIKRDKLFLISDAMMCIPPIKKL